EAAADDGIVKPGMFIECKLAGNTMKFVLGSREIAGDSDVEVYSVASPLGAAIEGRKASDTVTYQAPNGKDIQVELVSVTPYKDSKYRAVRLRILRLTPKCGLST